MQCPRCQGSWVKKVGHDKEVDLPILECLLCNLKDTADGFMEYLAPVCTGMKCGKDCVCS